MNETQRTLQEDDGQLDRWAALAAERYQDLEGDREEPGTPHDVKRFLINSYLTRFTWLMRKSVHLTRAFDNFPALVRAFIRAVPPAPHDATAPADEERFLAWLTRTQALTPLQSDFITCQRGEYAVLTEARQKRLAHLRFQRLCKHAGERAAWLGVDRGLRVHFNPIRSAGQLRTTAFAVGEQLPPFEVLFYAVGSAVRATVLEEETADVVAALAVHGPCTLDEWAAVAEEKGRTRLAWLAGELAGLGLAALD